MTELTAYLCPELMILVPVLYVLGVILKKSPLQDWLIPYVLCGDPRGAVYRLQCVRKKSHQAGKGGAQRMKRRWLDLPARAFRMLYEAVFFCLYGME